MKVLFCEKCHDLFKLTRHELRACRCKRDKVKGQYREDGKHADVSENAVSIKIHNDSLKEAICRMKQLQKNKPSSTDRDYQILSAVAAWVRPNVGDGNPYTHLLEKKRRDRRPA